MDWPRALGDLHPPVYAGGSRGRRAAGDPGGAGAPPTPPATVAVHPTPSYFFLPYTPQTLYTNTTPHAACGKWDKPAFGWELEPFIPFGVLFWAMALGSEIRPCGGTPYALRPRPPIHILNPKPSTLNLKP